MGLSLAYNLFYEAPPQDVFDAFAMFYERSGFVLLQSEDQTIGVERTSYDEDDSLEIFEPNGGWTVMTLDRGWAFERETRRDAQLFVSSKLLCSGFFIRVYDGDYWAYELFDKGNFLDNFVQEVETSEGRPPGTDAGSPEAIVSVFPWLEVHDVTPYLVQENWDDPEERRRLDVPARPGDEFSRFDECSVLDFLRLLGLNVNMVNNRVTLATSVRRQFWIRPV